MTAVLDTDRPDTDIADRAPGASAADVPAGPVPPTTPAPSPKSPRGARVWRNRLVVLLMVAVAAFGAYRIVQFHDVRSDRLALGDVELTAQSIPVQTSYSGMLTAVSVHAGAHVTSGQQLATMAVTSTDSTGHPVTTAQKVLAPRAGYVVNDPLTVGSMLVPGMSFVDMYDPTDLQFVTSVPLSYLSRVHPGMTANLTAPGVSGTVTAVLERAVPRIGSSEQDVPVGDLQLVFAARNTAQINRLLPGLRFQGFIDTSTGNGHGGPALFVNS